MYPIHVFRCWKKKKKRGFPYFLFFVFYFVKLHASAHICSQYQEVAHSCSHVGSQGGSRGVRLDVCDAEDAIVFADKDDGDCKAFPSCVYDVAIASRNGVGSIF